MRFKRPYYILPVVVLPLLVVLQRPEITQSVHGTTLAVMKPVLVAGQSMVQTVSMVQDTFIRFWRAFEGQKRHESQIATLESKLVRFQEVLKENKRLRELLDFEDMLEGKKIAARIIGWDASPWRRTLLLDKGKSQGIEKNMAVVVRRGLVGRVLEVGPQTSRVLLLTDPDARVSAIASESRSQGAVAGDGTSKLRMLYLELGSGVEVEETVLSSGGGGFFPKGLRIGKIVALEKDADGLHLVAEIEPLVNFSKLEEVICIESFPEK